MTEAEIRAYIQTPEFEARCRTLSERLDAGPLSDEEGATLLGLPVDYFQWALAERAKKWSPTGGSA
jgi:hypothetical protein